MLLPLPSWAARSRPDFITLVLMYWWLTHPEKTGVFSGFMMGLLLDVMYGSLLGQHATGIVIASWIFVKQYQLIRVLPVFQQALIVLFALFIKQFISFWIDNGLGQMTGNILVYFSPCLLGALIWPWLFMTIRSVEHRYSKKI